MKLVVIFAVGWIFLELQAILYHRYWAKNLSVRLFFAQKAAVEGETGQLKEVITNRKFLPLPVLNVKFQMGRYLVFTSSSNFKITDQNYRSDIFSCMPWQEIRRTLDFDCKKRGYYQIRGADLISYDLFFLNHCVASLPMETSMYVYPGPADPVRLDLPLKNLLGQILARQALLRDTESDLLLKDEDLTEEAIRLCGSIAEKMIEQGVPVAVFSNGNDCLTGRPSRLEAGAGKDHLRSVMELLSRVQISAGNLGAHGAPFKRLFLVRRPRNGSPERKGRFPPRARPCPAGSRRRQGRGPAGIPSDGRTALSYDRPEKQQLRFRFVSLCDDLTGPAVVPGSGIRRSVPPEPRLAVDPAPAARRPASHQPAPFRGDL